MNKLNKLCECVFKMSWNHKNITSFLIIYFHTIVGFLKKQRTSSCALRTPINSYLWAIPKQNKKKRKSHNLLKPTAGYNFTIVRQFYSFKLSSQFQKKMTENHLVLQSVLSNLNHYNLSQRNDCINFSQNW